MNDVLKDLEEAQEALKRLVSSPSVSVNTENRIQAERLRVGLNRASTKIQNYNELQSLDKMIDNIADNLEKE